MAELILPATSKFALAFREPNLLVPGQKFVGDVVPDWSHPLLRNARYVVLANHGTLRTYSNKTNSSQPVVSGTLTGIDGHTAPADVSSRFYLDAVGADWRNNGTVAFAGIWDGTWYGGSWAKLLNFGASDLIRSTSGQWYCAGFAGSGFFDVQTGRQAWVLRQTGGYGGDSDVFVNGDVKSSGISNINTDASNSSFYFANDDSDNRYVKFGLGILIVADRYWSSEEAMYFYTNTYDVVKPANDLPLIISVASGGTAPTLSGLAATSITANSIVPQVDVDFP